MGVDTRGHQQCNRRAGEGARRAAPVSGDSELTSGAMELEAGGHGGPRVPGDVRETGVAHEQGEGNMHEALRG